MIKTWGKNFQMLLVTAFSIICVAVQALDFTEDDMNMIKAASGLVCFVSAFFFCTKRTRRQAICISLFLSILMLLSYFYNENANLVNVLWIWSYMGVAMLLFDFGMKKVYAATTFYVVCFIFAYLLLSGTLPLQALLINGSENHVSILCIYCMFIYYISIIDDDRKKYPLIPSLIIVFISVITACRSGILTGFVFLICLIVVNWEYMDHRKRSAYLLLLLIGSLFLIWVATKYFDVFGLTLEEKMDRRGPGFDDSRSELWREYFKGMFSDVGEFLLGVHTHDPQLGYLSEKGGNPHNSFLMLHAKYGLLGFVFVVYSLFKAIKKARRKNEKIYITLIVLIITRCFFDWTAFPGLYDVLFYYIIFYAYQNNQLVVNHK